MISATNCGQNVIIFCSSFIFVINYTATFKKYRVNSWSSVCPHGIYFSWVLVYFSFSRISSALIPPANNLLTTLSSWGLTPQCFINPDFFEQIFYLYNSLFCFSLCHCRLGSFRFAKFFDIV